MEKVLNKLVLKALNLNNINKDRVTLIFIELNNKTEEYEITVEFSKNKEKLKGFKTLNQAKNKTKEIIKQYSDNENEPVIIIDDIPYIGDDKNGQQGTQKKT